VLVEKGRGYTESVIAANVIMLLKLFVDPRKLGLVSGESGMMRLFPGLVRIPDVAFVSWRRIPGGTIPRDPVPDLVPDLAVEVLSRSNTRAEMTRKTSEYFEAGVRLLWTVDPDTRTIAVSLPAGPVRTLTEDDTLDGGDVLPGFSVPVRDIFAGLKKASG
jgi:Uma2 family endonuclease